MVRGAACQAPSLIASHDKSAAIDHDSDDDNNENEILSLADLRRKIADFTPEEPVGLDTYFGLVPTAQIPASFLDDQIIETSACGRFCVTEVGRL